MVYVPPQPPTASPAATTAPAVLVIEEPVLPEPAQAAPSEPSETEPGPVRRRRRTAPSTPSEPDEAAPEEPLPAEVPVLEPRESPAQQATLRRQIQESQEKLRQRITRLENLRMGASARRTRDDARAFLTHSQEALEKGDLQRALNLAQKAELLIQGLEQQQ